ncbi:MAG TPA: four-carbon acid sugar kinase family protein [Paenibacillaceae bacterium]
MRIAILADDLTGACDTGVQMARCGFATTVLLDAGKRPGTLSDVVAVDTDSRSLSAEEAYGRVAEACGLLLREKCDIFYKKIDSTMRGNIGAELDAVYRHVRPDFIVLAPSFPEAGRVVRGGHMFVHGVPLHETDAGRDPKHPVGLSFLPDVLGRQSDQPVAVVTAEELRGDGGVLEEKIRRCRGERIPYLLFDAETDADLGLIVSAVERSGCRVVWAGSAGLARALAARLSTCQGKDKPLPPVPDGSGTVCMAVGSVNSRSRRQLEAVLRLPGVAGFEMRSERVLEEESRRRELDRLRRAAEEAMRAAPRALVLYSSGSAEDVERARREGAGLGMDEGAVSGVVSRALGELVAGIVNGFGFRHLVLTGGDTARQVCLRLGARAIELAGELEPGVPVGRLVDAGERWVVTKAGGFGSEQVLCNALRFFRREDVS